MRLVVFRSDYFRDLDSSAAPEVATVDAPDVALRDPITLHIGQEPDALPKALRAIASPVAMHVAPADPIGEWNNTIGGIMEQRGLSKQRAVLFAMEHMPEVHERYIEAFNGKS